MQFGQGGRQAPDPQAMTFDEFLKSLGEPLELDWRKYRRRSARRHVAGRLQELGLTGFDRYREYVASHPEEARRLPDLMRVTVSRFFRDAACWQELARTLAHLPCRHDGAGRLRAWSAGCCGGEEPYSLATLLASAGGGEEGARLPAEILATDIDSAVLDRAREACYEAPALREVPADIRSRAFVYSNGRWCVAPAVRARVRFLRHNLLEDPPPGGNDLTLCRYLAFTYYRGGRRRQAAERLWRSLRPGGLLFIGRKESLGRGLDDLFVSREGSEFIFRRREPAG